MDDGQGFVDNDSDSSSGFEIGIDNAGEAKGKKGQQNIYNQEDSADSFDRQSSHGKGDGFDDDSNAHEFLNQSGNKKAISAAIEKVR
jgi:hypothetical protein